jgi:uncharacterized protein YnzC (UPF0291/DUF896 family)
MSILTKEEEKDFSDWIESITLVDEEGNAVPADEIEPDEEGEDE